MIICPRCEKEMGPEHKCARGVSRRFFFQIAFGGIAAAVASQMPQAAPVVPPILVEPLKYRDWANVEQLVWVTKWYGMSPAGSLAGDAQGFWGKWPKLDGESNG